MDRKMSMAAFLDYLHEHPATTELSKMLGEAVMLRMCQARPVGPDPQRRAS